MFSLAGSGYEMMMVDRLRPGTLVWLALGALALGACAGDRDLATEHIRSTLGGADPAAVTAPEEAGLNGAAPGEEAASAPARESDTGEAEGTPPVVTLPEGDTLQIRSAVVEFYDARAYEPAWTTHAELSREGARLLGALASLELEGLDPSRYHVPAAQSMARVLSEREAGENRLALLGDLDMLLTEGFVRAASDLSRGVLDPEAGGLEWRIERPEADDEAVVARLAAGDDPAAVLASVRPKAPYYRRLAEGLSRLRAVEERGGWPEVPAGETLRVGDRDERVAFLRGRLLAGEDEVERRLASTGRADPALFDEDLQQALEHFQARHTLHEDGAVGPNTLAAMNVPVSERIRSVRLNLDRWRWLPRELGDEFLLVNVAGFELELVAGDSVIESMAVVVGRTANRTPLFRDSLQYVVVNPYWNVPMSIAREEIIPAVRRDPGYLERNGYEVLRNGRLVNSYHTSAEALESGSYLIRQRPGPQNALGNVKIMFPNDLNIYLHDTPAGHLFGQETRAFSYGCIRLERPEDLAKTLLARYSRHDPSEYDRLRQERSEKWLTLDQQIPIYILYFTAWARADGTLRFHPDIYDRDQALESEQQALLPATPVMRSTPEPTTRA
jgi:L,D-transpeptidase YcbB